MTYWDKVLTRRVTRRRGLAALGAGTAAAAFLAACGGDDDAGSGTGSTGGTGATGGATGGTGSTGSTGSTGTSSLLSEIVDTTAAAVPGGTLVTSNSSEPNHLDGGIQGQGSLNLFNALAYSGLVSTRPGFKQASTYTEVDPNLAESFEISPDGLEITFKLRQDVTFADIAPVSGRAFDSEDVVATWKRYEAVGGNRAANVNSVNPGAPMISVTATDKYTVVYKLARPSSFIMQRIANMITGEAGTIFPREVDEGFDPRLQQIGTGGFQLVEYQPSIGFKYMKRPGYHQSPQPFIDNLEISILPEYATRLAQFKAGNIPAIEPEVLSQDIVATKKEEPRINLYRNLDATINPGPMARFGWLPIDGKPSPFLDVRVRRAFSMALDRDEFINAFGNVDRFEAEGLPVDTFYHTSQGYVPGISLDPRDAASFGENAQWYIYNPEEATKLLEAALPDGFPSTKVYFNTIGFFGADHGDQVQVITEMANQVGFDLTTEGIDYNLDYLPKFVTQQGKHEGIVFTWGASTSLDPLDYYIWRFYSKSGATSGSIGFGGPDGSLGDQSGDPEVDTLIEKGMAETDQEARAAILQDLQRHLAGQQYGVMRPGTWSDFRMAWPALSNYLTFQNDGRSVSQDLGYYTWWLDQTKAPFA